jgi:hypothetical protein
VELRNNTRGVKLVTTTRLMIIINIIIIIIINSFVVFSDEHPYVW